MELCTLEQAQRVARALLEAIEAFRFLWDDKAFNVGASFGLVPITEASENLSEVLRAADAACYTAKDQGRNRIHVYREGDAEVARRHREFRWVTYIPRALEENRFKLYCQPIVAVCAPERPACHHELFVRIEDPEGGLILPGAFLPVAERYNLAAKLDAWVLGTALRWLNSQPARLAELGLCAINLSGLSLGNEEFLRFVLRSFEELPIPPEKLCFEITETAAITNLTDACRFIKVLHERGCQFALDDFGSGLSSFAYLKNLPVDFLKIDGAFVKGIVDDPIDLAMVRSIKEIGQVMGKQIIAEFVESAGILAKLREIGIDYAQGYFLGVPRAMEEMALPPGQP